MGKRFSVDNDDIPEVEKPVKLISITPDSEKLVAYCARVSSNQQDNPSISKLCDTVLNINTGLSLRLLI